MFLIFKMFYAKNICKVLQNICKTFLRVKDRRWLHVK